VVVVEVSDSLVVARRSEAVVEGEVSLAGRLSVEFVARTSARTFELRLAVQEWLHHMVAPNGHIAWMSGIGSIWHDMIRIDADALALLASTRKMPLPEKECLDPDEKIPKSFTQTV
jgi:hypothetical protein